ncbi:hypothetical protein HK102_000672, partial [Quaeritorhiza haematococci]
MSTPVLTTQYPLLFFRLIAPSTFDISDIIFNLTSIPPRVRYRIPSPPISHPSGTIIYALTFDSVRSPGQSELKLFGISTSTSSTPSVVFDITVPGSYNLQVAPYSATAGQYLLFLGVVRDVVSLIWVADDERNGTRLGATPPTAIHAYFLTRDGSSSSGWKALTPSVSTFPTGPNFKFDPKIPSAPSNTFIYLSAVETKNFQSCILRYDITSPPNPDGSLPSLCAPVPFNPINDIDLPLNVEPPNPDSQVFYITGGGDQLAYQAAWSNLLGNGFRNNIGPQGSVRAIPYSDTYALVTNASGIGLWNTKSPNSWQNVWVASNEALEHQPGLAKSVVAIDDQRGWIYVCKNMVPYNSNTTTTTTSSVSPPLVNTRPDITTRGTYWNGTLTALLNDTGLPAWATTSTSTSSSSQSLPTIPCSNSSILLLDDNSFLVITPSSASLYAIRTTSTREGGDSVSITSSWSIPFNSSSSEALPPNLLSAALEPSTLFLANSIYTLPTSIRRTPTDTPGGASGTAGGGNSNLPKTVGVLPLSGFVALMVIVGVAVVAGIVAGFIVVSRKKKQGGVKGRRTRRGAKDGRDGGEREGEAGSGKSETRVRGVVGVVGAGAGAGAAIVKSEHSAVVPMTKESGGGGVGVNLDIGEEETFHTLASSDEEVRDNLPGEISWSSYVQEYASDQPHLPASVDGTVLSTSRASSAASSSSLSLTNSNNKLHER